MINRDDSFKATELNLQDLIIISSGLTAYKEVYPTTDKVKSVENKIHNQLKELLTKNKSL